VTAVAAAATTDHLSVVFHRPVAAAGATGARTVGGLAVPWGVPGRVADGRTVVFDPGSLDAAARPVALRDHDRGRAVGRVVDAVDTGAGIDATVRLAPQVPDADQVLALAADGVPLMFSVGATPTDADYDADGTLHVRAGTWDELSILTFGAFGGATVDRVAAAATTGGTMPPDLLTLDDDESTPDEPDAPPEPDPDAPDPADGAEHVTLEPVTAAAGFRPFRRAAAARAHPFAGVDLATLSRYIAAAATSADPRIVGHVQRVLTSPGARAFPLDAPIAAALTDVTLVGTNNVGAAYRPGYQAELVDIVSHGSPAVDMVRQGNLERGDYPNKTFNKWTKVPTVALQSAEKVAINTTPVQIVPTAVPVQTWATGNDISQQALDFGSPSFIDDYIRAAGVSYASVIDTYAVTALLAAATDVPTVLGDKLPVIIGKLFAALNPANVPAGPMVMLVSWDLGAGAMGIVGQDNAPVFWDGTVNFGSFTPSVDMGGLTVQVDPNMPANTAILMLANAATWYDLPGTPFSLRAINVGQLGLDVAVYGYGALGVQYQGAIVKTTVPQT